MKKYAIAALAIVALGAAIAVAQVISIPPPAGVALIACVYNLTPPTLTTGQPAYAQCDSTGHLVAGGGAGGNSTIISPLGHATADAAAVSIVPSATAVFPLGNLNGAALDTSLATLHTDLTTLNTTAAAPATLSSQYPFGAVPITASATGTTAATTATLAASASIHTYLCGFSIRANATAAATANSTVTGTVTATMNFTQWTAPLASGIGLTEMIFNPCVPSSAINTGIAVISAAPGSGGVVSVSAWGYQL
jgi:hypothetical protein